MEKRKIPNFNTMKEAREWREKLWEGAEERSIQDMLNKKERKELYSILKSKDPKALKDFMYAHEGSFKIGEHDYTDFLYNVIARRKEETAKLLEKTI